MSEEVKYEPLPENKAKWRWVKAYFNKVESEGLELAYELLKRQPYYAAELIKAIETIKSMKFRFTVPIHERECERARNAGVPEDVRGVVSKALNSED